MVAVGDDEDLGPGDEARQSLRRAGDGIPVADGDQRRDADRGQLLGREGLPRPAHTGGERQSVAAGLIGELPVGTAGPAGHVGEARRLERGDDLVLALHALDHGVAHAAEDHRAHAVLVRQRQRHGDAGAHRISHHVGPGDAEMVEQPGRIVGQERQRIRLRIADLLASPMATDIHGDDPPAGPLERVDPPGGAPVHNVVRREAVDKEDRVAFPAVEECDIDPIG